jgi:hypothetical protein
MSASDLASVIISVAALMAVGVVVWLVTELRRSTEELTSALDDLRRNVGASMARLDAQAEAVDADLRRVDGLIDSAEKVSARADALSRVTYGAVAKPVIKTAAVVKGTSKAARRLRRGAEADPERRTG